MPHLEQLKITPHLGFALPQLLRSLSHNATVACVCPKLRVVQLSVDQALNAEALIAFVRSRRNIALGDEVVQLNSIRLKPFFFQWVPGKALRDLKGFQDEGLEILVWQLEVGWRGVMLHED
jgi:hypothetical protein